MSVPSSNIIGGGDQSKRVKNDFYPSPIECTTSLLAKEMPYLKGQKILEPCCGDGAISKILEANGLDVFSTDLIYRGYGIGNTDFLTMSHTDCGAIVTNPPFNLASEFIEHSLGTLKVDYLAVIVKAHFWHAKKRQALFRKYPPAMLYAMTWRPDFLQKGAPTMDFIWTVWRKSEVTQYALLDRV